MGTTKKWIVTTSGGRQLEQVATEAAGAGFTVEQVLGEIGSITGSGSDEVAEKLRGIQGIEDVSPDLPVDIGPPESPVTW